MKVRLAAAVALVIAAFVLMDGPLEASVAEHQRYDSASYLYDAGTDHVRANASEVERFDATPARPEDLRADSRGLGDLDDHAASFVAPRVADDLVDLVSPSRRHHILDGEVRPNGTYGGGHRAGTGYPGKSEFPARWSDDRDCCISG